MTSNGTERTIAEVHKFEPEDFKVWIKNQNGHKYAEPNKSGLIWHGHQVTGLKK